MTEDANNEVFGQPAPVEGTTGPKPTEAQPEAQGTPVETPPVQEASEERTTEEQTTREELFQTKYQKLIAATKEEAPEVAQRFLDGGYNVPIPQTPPPATEDKVKATEYSGEEFDNTPEQIAKIVREELQRDRADIQQQQQQAYAQQMQVRFQSNVAQAKTALDTFCVENNIAPEARAAMEREAVDSFGVHPANNVSAPLQFAKLVGKLLTGQTQAGQGNTLLNQTQVADQAKVDALKGLQTPAGPGVPLPGNMSETEQDKALAEMMAVNGNQAAKDIFGG